MSAYRGRRPGRPALRANLACGLTQAIRPPRNRRARLSAREQYPAIGCGSARPTPTVSGERHPFDNDAGEPRSDSGAEASRTEHASREGNGRSRAERPTVAGVDFRCEATALRRLHYAQTRQFMIGGPVGGMEPQGSRY